ncbi:MAG: CHAT domain-containing protein [Oscillatoria princeps RMCB-10]|jgi:filamentous hemagglutinin family protein|nr:CHAT domain-containing protein [Oscillatoria princeps RMCB-10]
MLSAVSRTARVFLSQKEETVKRARAKFYFLPFVFCLLPLVATAGVGKVRAQTIVPASDGTGTAVTPTGNQFNITGGARSKDGANLFHSFTKFGLSAEQIANFQSSPAIRNIFGRVTGGSISQIDGLIKVTGGSANLFLINPSGIVLGGSARLDVPASFTATAASGIGFGSNLFNAAGTNDYAALVGSPSAFYFGMAQPGAILNFGQLTVPDGQNLTLLGGTVTSTGTLSAPGGQITAAPVPGGSAVRLSQEGHVLSVDIPPLPPDSPERRRDRDSITPLSLPEFLTGGSFGSATGMRAHRDGTVRLTGSGIRLENGELVAQNRRAGTPGQASRLSDAEPLGQAGRLSYADAPGAPPAGVSSGHPSFSAPGSPHSPARHPPGPQPFAAHFGPVPPGGRAPAPVRGPGPHMPGMPVFAATVGKILAAGDLQQATRQIEQQRGGEFGQFLGENLSATAVTTQSIRDTLGTIASQTGTKSAIVYAIALPDQLELLLYTPEGKPIRHTIPAANRETLLKEVAELRTEITDTRQRNSSSYLAPAQKLYQWLIAPLEADLQAAGINTLLFSMDAGLRSLPLAALHDGKQFLIEKYSLSLIPSISLTDTRYASLKNAQVLAMGASTFADQKPLPAVPVELDAITQHLWRGKAFLNQEFTPKNLNEQRQNAPYRIIHLATHAEFQSGTASNSYIYFWNTKLHLDQLRQLRLSEPPVELLVLSACRTAIGDTQAELGFAGLAVGAGVKSALASLWYVSDEGTLGLMTEFYRQLAEAPVKAEALRQAQLALLRGQVRISGGNLKGSGEFPSLPLPPELAALGERTFSHPYYWAGFTLIGSPW